MPIDKQAALAQIDDVLADWSTVQRHMDEGRGDDEVAERAVIARMRGLIASLVPPGSPHISVLHTQYGNYYDEMLDLVGVVKALRADYEAGDGLLQANTGLVAFDKDGPIAVRQQILQSIVEIQGHSNRYTNDQQLANRLGLTVEEVDGHLEILRDQGNLNFIRSSAGCSAFLMDGHKQRFKESKQRRLKDVVAVSHPGSSSSGKIDLRKVFVVYGRNNAAREAMFTFLRAIGLHPLEWSEIVKETGEASPYVGKVLETGFSVVQAVVVLMTPDDEARLREQYQGHDEPREETQLTPQPRPNVLLEAGMALGLFPDRTVIVELGRLRSVSDIGGRHVIRMDNSTEKRQELAQRLQTAGCTVNVTGTDWHKAGRFDLALVGR